MKNANLTANNSEALVIEGKNSITLEDCYVTGNMSDTKGTSSSENVHNVMIYQSMSGDADVGTSVFSMTGGSLVGSSGDMFYITNTRCLLTLSGVNIVNNDADGALLPTAGGSVTPEEPDYFAGGDGSVGDPYQIATEAQLRAFAEATQAGKLVTTNVYFVLTADIALNGEWTPVHSFGGTFDGGDHTVSGMTIGTAEAPSTLVSAGFFDVLANTAKVHDLHLTNASVYVQRSGAALDDRIYAGGLVGGAGTAGSNVRIDNCSVTGSTISATSGTFAYAGGFAGRLDRENVVTNCWTDIAVTAVSANSPACAGGLVATIGGSSMIANAAALGDVSVTGVSAEYNWCRAGGLLGSSAYLTHNCYASGNVSLQNSAESVKNVYLGCLIGEQSGGVVVSGHYFNGAVLRCNGETQTVKATGSIPASWYFDYNKITAHDSVTDAAFAAALNDGISESGLAETDAYLTSSGTFTSYTAEGLAAMRPAAWQSWGLADGKVVLGGYDVCGRRRLRDRSVPHPYRSAAARLRSDDGGRRDLCRSVCRAGCRYPPERRLDADPFLRRYVRRPGPHGLRHDHRHGVRSGRCLGYAARLL